MKANPEQSAFNCLKTLAGDFIEYHFSRVGDTKTVPIGHRVQMNLEIIDMDSISTRFLIRVMDDNKLESFAWKVQVYLMGFVRAYTFEQHGVIWQRADREEDQSRDYEAFAAINSFFQQFLDIAATEVIRASLKVPAYIPAPKLGKVA